MTNGSGDRLTQIEGVLASLATRQEEFEAQAAKRREAFEAHMEDHYQRMAKVQSEMAARQQYHDEALEHHDAEMKRILEAIDADGEHIRALVRIAELHSRRLEDLEDRPPQT